MSMARLWRDQGKRDDACDLLPPVYGWFTEGLNTLDLKGAGALLNTGLFRISTADPRIVLTMSSGMFHGCRLLC